MRDNIGEDYCRVCGRMLENGTICEDCKKRMDNLNKKQEVK